MSNSKLKNFPRRKSSEASEFNQKDKHLITQLKNLINEKIKNPEVAKKAARILEEMMGK
jgi:hypothetical protein